MNQRLLAIAAIAVALDCHSATIRSFDLSEDKASLLVRLSDGSTFTAPHTSADQEGFSDVQISPNRRYIGWAVTFGNCCTSYPLPRALVVHDGTRIVRMAGTESLSIFDWRFSQDSQAFIFQRELPHGNSPHFFRRVRISDGKLLEEFDCEVIDPDHPPARYLHPPKWTGAENLDCPA